MNRLSRYCQGLMEAAWLSIIFITPVFFNIDSSVTFEAPKIMLFRSLVLVALAAWGVKLISEGGLRFERVPQPAIVGAFLRIPLVFPIVLLAAAYIVSTLFSISSPISLTGSLYRSESVYTLISYVLLFIILAANLRRRAQVERLLVLLAVASLVVDLFAFLQKFNLDPHILQIWNVDVLERVASTVGHPIFTGAFLGMSVFVLFGRALLAFQVYREKRASRVGDLIRAVIYTIIAGLNLLALWYTDSRGPLLGMFAGFAVFLIFLLLHFGLRKILAAVLGLGALAALFLVLLNLPGGPLENLRQSPSIGPLGRVFELQGGTGRMRVLMWTGMSSLMSPHEPLSIPGENPASGTPDRWNLIRPLIGYGPETIRQVYESYYDPEMYITESRTVTFDRSHNGFWDAWGFFGLLGLAATFGLFLSVVYFSLKWLNLIRLPFDQKLYWGLSLGAGLLVSVGLIWQSQARYLGLGFPLALLAGPAGIVILRVIRPVPLTETGLESWRALTLIGFLAALVSHYVEMLSGIAVVATSSLFWVFCALIFIIGQFPVPDEEAASGASLKGSPRSGRSASKKDPADQLWSKALRRIGVNVGALVLILTTLGAVFIVVPQAAESAFGTLLNSFTSLVDKDRPVSFGILGMVFLAWLVAGLLLQFESDALAKRKPGWADLLTTLGLALALALFFWLIRASQLVSIKAAQVGGDIIAFSNGIIGLLTVFCGLLLLISLVWAFAFPAEEKRPARAGSFELASLAGIILVPVFALVFAVSTNLLPMQADIFFGLGKSVVNQTQKEAVKGMYDRALELAPAQSEYFLTVGSKYYRDAGSEADPTKREGWIKLSLEKLQRAYQLSPLIADNMIALAKTYQLWGQSTQDQTLQASRYAQAETYYQAALNRSGGRVDYLLDWGDFLISRGNFSVAQKEIKAALAVDGAYDVSYALLGKSYLAQASTEKDPTLRAEALNQAAQVFQKQADLLTQQGGNPALALINLGNAYQSLQQYEPARNAYLKATDLGAGDYQWKVYLEIAKLTSLLKEPVSNVRVYLQKALASAPAAEKPALQARLDALVP